jgi:hypothetical protein
MVKSGYAKDCIPLENNCNVTVVTGGGERVVAGASPRSYGGPSNLARMRRG